MNSVGRIFISYRRDDASGTAGRLYDRLAARLGTDRVFMDVDSISPGYDFAKAIEYAVARCDVVLALIGNEWLAAVDRWGRRRLDDPNDFVALEINAGLARNIPVIPVMVDGALQIQAADLPRHISALARRQGVRIHHESFSADIDKLLSALQRLVPALRTNEVPHVTGGTSASNSIGPSSMPNIGRTYHPARSQPVVNALTYYQHERPVQVTPNLHTPHFVRSRKLRPWLVTLVIIFTLLGASATFTQVLSVANAGSSDSRSGGSGYGSGSGGSGSGGSGSGGSGSGGSGSGGYGSDTSSGGSGSSSGDSGGYNPPTSTPPTSTPPTSTPPTSTPPTSTPPTSTPPTSTPPTLDPPPTSTPPTPTPPTPTPPSPES